MTLMKSKLDCLVIDLDQQFEIYTAAFTPKSLYSWIRGPLKKLGKQYYQPHPKDEARTF